VGLLAGLLGLALGGLVVGALARLAIPGPDPMPLWLTMAIGILGTLVGGGAGYALVGGTGYFLGAVIGAALLVIVYRRFVQRRPITGPEAFAPPRRGFGSRRR
jgi:uncharacterized membrane protein YeaQ/YmgE (transglycosylase-associated protein family)